MPEATRSIRDGYTETTTTLLPGESMWQPGTTKHEFVGPGVVVVRVYEDGVTSLVSSTAKTRPIRGRSR